MVKSVGSRFGIRKSSDWFGVAVAVAGMLACGGTAVRGTCLRGRTSIAATPRDGSEEWTWFELPEEADGLFRRQGLLIVSAKPLWMRNVQDSSVRHIRVVATLESELTVAEVRWDASRVDAESSNLVESSRQSRSLGNNRGLQMALDRCVEVLTSGCEGGTIESSEWSGELTTLGSARETVELRVGDAVYAVARRNAGLKAKERGLLELNRCACEVLRLSDSTVVCN